MSFGEYMDMINASGLITETFSKNAVRPCFVYSLMIVENELTTSAYKQMTPVEFYEAVSDDRLSCTDALLQSSLRVLCGTDWKAYPRHGPRPACSPVPEAAAGDRSAGAGATEWMRRGCKSLSYVMLNIAQ